MTTKAAHREHGYGPIPLRMEWERALAIDPESFEKLWWGSSVMGLTAHLAQADPNLISELLRLYWLRKAPKGLKKDHGDLH